MRFAAPSHSQPPQQRLGHGALIMIAEAVEHRDQRVGLAQRAQRYGELRRIPMDRLGLAAESVEPGMVEIGGGEAGVPGRVEAPGAVIEALRSEEHTSELQSLMRTSYAVFCLK